MICFPLKLNYKSLKPTTFFKIDKLVSLTFLSFDSLILKYF